ncbi:MAG TPA: Smr/MutS family protein [Pyrinomonadaceae bacterium]|nr:Smr/MutS family protein [Pyrinomonadaceae bacterium]
MSRPKDIEEKLERVLNAWRTLAPDKSFGGMTLAQCEAACAPSSTTRARIAELEDRLRQAQAERDAADAVTASKLQLVINGILADTPFVERFTDAPPDAGGWGATIAYLLTDEGAAQ